METDVKHPPRECRVCKMEEEADHPLYSPCLCKGSIKYIHQDCLTQWIEMKKISNCELCGHTFQFTNIYAKNAPPKVRDLDIFIWVVTKVLSLIPLCLRAVLVIFCWLCIPLLTWWILKALLAPFQALSFSTFVDDWSPAALLRDLRFGIFASLFICVFSICTAWFRELVNELEPAAANNRREPEIEINDVGEPFIIDDPNDVQEEELIEHLDDMPLATIIGFTGPLYYFGIHFLSVLLYNVSFLALIFSLPLHLGRTLLCLQSFLPIFVTDLVAWARIELKTLVDEICVLLADALVYADSCFDFGDASPLAGLAVMLNASNISAALTSTATNFATEVPSLNSSATPVIIKETSGATSFNLLIFLWKYIESIFSKFEVSSVAISELLGFPALGLNTTTSEPAQAAAASVQAGPAWLSAAELSSPLLTGYLLLVLVAVAPGLEPIMERVPLAAFVRNSLRMVLLGIKVGCMLFLEMVVFPFLLGWTLDALLLEMLGARLADHFTFTQKHSVLSFVAHWLAGLLFMIYVAFVASVARQVVRKSILRKFIRYPDDPDFNPLLDLVEVNSLTQLRRLFISLLLYITLIFLMAHVPSRIGARLFPGLVPLHIGLNESFEVPLDLLIFHFSVPFILDRFSLQAVSTTFISGWLHKVCCALGIHNYLLIQPGFVEKDPEPVRPNNNDNNNNNINNNNNNNNNNNDNINNSNDAAEGNFGDQVEEDSLLEEMAEDFAAHFGDEIFSSDEDDDPDLRNEATTQAYLRKLDQLPAPEEKLIKQATELANARAQLAQAGELEAKAEGVRGGRGVKWMAVREARVGPGSEPSAVAENPSNEADESGREADNNEDNNRAAVAPPVAPALLNDNDDNNNNINENHNNPNNLNNNIINNNTDAPRREYLLPADIPRFALRLMALFVAWWFTHICTVQRKL
jgi:hypothetical protein